jgi:predicted nucleic acid-binding protein
VTPNGKLVIDASVAVKWYLPEKGSESASGLLNGELRLLAPDLLIAEFGNTLWKKTRKGELMPREARTIVDAFVSTPPVIICPSTPLLPGALDIAVGFHRSVYDALYLALAVAERCPFVTADDRLVRSLQRTKLRALVQPLSHHDR